MGVASPENNKAEAKLLATLMCVYLVLGDLSGYKLSKMKFDKRKSSLTNRWKLAMIELMMSVAQNDIDRLKWLPAITPEDDSTIVAKLLPQIDGSFEMATLALISDFCTEEERAAIFDRYLEMFDAALSADDTAELGNLLSLVAYWNNSLSIRPKFTEAANKAVSIGSLTLPEKHVNTIAAEFYAQIVGLTGKYDELEGLQHDDHREQFRREYTKIRSYSKNGCQNCILTSPSKTLANLTISYSISL